MLDAPPTESTPVRGVGAAKNRALELISIAASMPPTIALAMWPTQTQVWMWALWSLGASLGAIWSFRVRAWGFVVLHGTYLTLNLIGLTRLLELSK